MELSVTSFDFPGGVPNGETMLSFTKAELCWAALMVGKPNKAAATAHGTYSKYESLFRWNMVLSALDFVSTPDKAVNSVLFDALDPTEKGGINFYLGMIFLKLCAQKLLDIPWLIHLNWMKSNHALTLLYGKSSPDLLGYDVAQARWAVFEAKGRNAGYSAAILGKAKNQADRVIKVDGSLCSLHVGSLLHRNDAKQLEFVWQDPSLAREDPIELETDRETWLEYYAPIYDLYLQQGKNRRAFRERMGFNISIHPFARAFVDALKEDRDYSNERGSLQRWSAERSKRPIGIWNGDGIGIWINEDWK